jgi:hypothetical protein
MGDGLLEDYSAEELQQEIDRRKAVKKIVDQKPKPKEGFHKDIVDICEGYMRSVEKGEDREDDSQYIFEALLQTVYGNNVFDWINKINRER